MTDQSGIAAARKIDAAREAIGLIAGIDSELAYIGVGSMRCMAQILQTAALLVTEAAESMERDPDWSSAMDARHAKGEADD